MPTPIHVFVCHKKLLAPESSPQVMYENTKASVLHAILQMRPEMYDAWIDDSEIAAGMAWEAEIYERLLISDVLLVAIGPGTSRSEWVRREIALAKALGIAIVPLGYDLTASEFGNELKLLHIDGIQGKRTQNIKISAKDALLQEIQSDLELARQRTVIDQAKVLSKFTSRLHAPIPKADDKQKAFTIEVDLCGSKINLHVATGDLTKTRGIDVLVNSENDYMQMARFFESRTVSSLLRRRGASIADGKYVDVIQRELDAQLGDRARPVQAAEVFITSAGGPLSQLARENKTRYLFHVAAVQAIDAESRVAPFKQPHQIEDCVFSCLNRLLELNKAHGLISPQGTAQRAEQERVSLDGNGTSRSILFPLFGTGQGGSSASDAIGPMLSGVRRFFEDPDNGELAQDVSDIYFAAFTQPDAEIVIKKLASAFG